MHLRHTVLQLAEKWVFPACEAANRMALFILFCILHRFLICSSYIPYDRFAILRSINNCTVFCILPSFLGGIHS